MYPAGGMSPNNFNVITSYSIHYTKLYDTGLVVTGEVDVERGTHGVAGDTINLASRLSSLAQSGEI